MNITVYSTTTCPFCKLEKEWLAEKGVAFTSKVVDEHPGLAEELISRTNQLSVPVTIIEKEGKETVVVGFDKKRLAEAIGIS